MRNRLRALWRVTLMATLGLEAIYLVSANTFLNTSLAPLTFNRHPERFSIVWKSAWTLWPGMVTLRGVETGGRSRRIEWHAHVDSVSTTFRPLPLFRRTVHLGSARAEGVDYRQRRREPQGAATRVPSSELPPMPERPGAGPATTAPGATVDRDRPAKRPGAPWTVRADRIACDVTQIWIDRFRLAGPMRVETGMSLVVRGPLEFPDVRITMESGALWAGEQTIFDALHLDIEAVIHPFVPAQVRRLAAFHFLSGRFDLRSAGASLFFLDPYFRKTPWVKFRDRAPGQATLILDHGRLQPGTKFGIRNDRIKIEIVDRLLTGEGEVTGIVEAGDAGAHARVSAILRTFQISPAAEGSMPYAHGRLMSLESDSTSLDLSDPFTSLDVVFDLGEAAILDPGFYNSFIPVGSGFRVISGDGTMNYHLEGSQEQHSLHGDIELTVDHGVARFQTYNLRGGFKLMTHLRAADSAGRLFDISGTRADLYSDNFPWKAIVRLPRARMRFADPATIDATVHIDMQDTRPLVAIFDALRGIPDWIQHMLTVRHVHGIAALSTRPGLATVNDLEVTGEGLHALADLTLGEARDGILYVRLHGFSVGIEMKQGKRHIKLFLPRTWFDKERARRRGTAPADSVGTEPG
jgi:hypothetical protein